MSQAPSASPAEHYESFFVPVLFGPLTRQLLERVAPQRGERVLDVACGTGAVSRQVASLVGSEGLVVGLDVSPDMIAVARRLAPDGGAPIEWCEAEASAMPFADASFDLVLCQQGLQFFPDRPAGLREMHRVLRPGGRLGLSVWQGLDRQPIFGPMIRSEAEHLDVPIARLGLPFVFDDPDEVRGLIEDAGFSEVDVAPSTLRVRFPSSQGFLEEVLHAAAAVLPDLASDDAARRDLAEAIEADMADALDRHRDGEGLAFPMPLHTVTARA